MKQAKEWYSKLTASARYEAFKLAGYDMPATDKKILLVYKYIHNK